MRKLGRLIVVLVGALAVAAPLAAGAQEEQGQGQRRTKIYVPEDPSKIHGGLSIKAVDIVPQLLQSVEFATMAGNVVSRAQSEADLVHAADLIHRAYVLQRASHAGLDYLEREKQKPGSMIAWEDRVITASRKNLVAAEGYFRGTRLTDVNRIENGMDHLRAAIGQTQSVIAVHR